VLRFLGYIWAFPVTVVGVGLAILAGLSGGDVHLRGGIIEASGGRLHGLLRGGRIFRGGAAMTLGHVILARDAACLELSRRHEQAHVRQFERWGLLLPPVYCVLAWWLAMRGYDPHLDHPFETEAYDQSSNI
jgi:hypothetical protein